MHQNLRFILKVIYTQTIINVRFGFLLRSKRDGFSGAPIYYLLPQKGSNAFFLFLRHMKENNRSKMQWKIFICSTAALFFVHIFNWARRQSVFIIEHISTICRCRIMGNRLAGGLVISLIGLKIHDKSHFSIWYQYLYHSYLL